MCETGIVHAIALRGHVGHEDFQSDFTVEFCILRKLDTSPMPPAPSLEMMR